MSNRTRENFVIYDDQFYGGMTEVLQQEANAFNGASANTIQVADAASLGDFSTESFFKALASGSLARRRDITTNNAGTINTLSQDEHVTVKVNRYNITDIKLDQLKKQGKDSGEFSFVLGEQFAKQLMLDYLNNGIAAASAAVGQDNEQNNDTGTITTAGLVQALSVMGDQADRIGAFVMHSKAYYDLVQQQIASNIYDISSVNIKEGTPITLGRPVIVTDSPSLISAGTGPGAVDEYYTLALTEGAIRVEESEERTVYSEIVTGNENLVLRLQNEWAFNLGLKGYKYDIANGGVNPTDAAIATATNWDKIASDDKDLLGVRLVTQ